MKLVFQKREKMGIRKAGREMLPRFFLFKDFFCSKPVFWVLGIGIFLNLVNWGLLWFFLRPLDSNVILHYNVYFGVDREGDSRQAFYLPLIGALLIFANLLFSLYFWEKKERVASHMLLMASLMIQFGLLVASLSLILINY